MSLYAYRVLQTVVQEKSFSRAAERLRLSPSAVSHTIAKLEEGLGFSLFDRGRKNAVLNQNGAQVYRYVEDILYSSDMLERRASQIRGSSAGVVRLGVIDSVAVNWLPGILERFRAEYPAVEVQVEENIYTKLLESLIAHELDIAIVSQASVRHMKTALQFIPLYEDRIVCVSPKDFEPKNEGFISAEELADLEVILPVDGDGIDIEDWIQEQEWKAQPGSTVLANTSLAAMVRCGLGHGIIPALTLEGIGPLEDITIRPVVPLGFRTLGAATFPQKFLQPVVQGMLDCIAGYAEGLEG